VPSIPKVPSQRRVGSSPTARTSFNYHKINDLYWVSDSGFFTPQSKGNTGVTRAQRSPGNWPTLNGLQVNETPTISRPSLRFPKAKHSKGTPVRHAMNLILVHEHSCGTPIVWN
jgi:hypothetical protein